MKTKSVYYVIGGPYVSDQAGLPLILNVFRCYFVYTFCEDRINTFLILILNRKDSCDSCRASCEKLNINFKLNFYQDTVYVHNTKYPRNRRCYGMTRVVIYSAIHGVTYVVPFV